MTSPASAPGRTRCSSTPPPRPGGVSGPWPGPFDREAEGSASGLSLTVSWHRDPRAPVEALAGFTEIAARAGGPGGGGSPHGPSNPTPDRRVSVRMTADAHCRYLLDVCVAAEPPR